MRTINQLKATLAKAIERLFLKYGYIVFQSTLVIAIYFTICAVQHFEWMNMQ